MRLVPSEHQKKFRIVRCGVDLKNFQRVSKSQNNVPHILCVGRLTKNKGQHILLQTCFELKQSAQHFHLTFVGDGEDRESLENLTAELDLKSQVTFTGSVGQEKIKEFYKKADLFVLPSFAEGVPIVLMEAMAMGVPVISTNITGIPELIEDGKSGFLTFASDIGDLKQKMMFLFTNPNLRAEFTKNARKTVELNYNIGKNCKQLAEVFERERKL
jgi:glycosyltransferase involved in cell wall biosynthesis